MKAELIDMLEEIIEAGQEAEMPLDMDKWLKYNPCGYSCCLIGDLLIDRDGTLGANRFGSRAAEIAGDLDELFESVLDDYDISVSIYFSTSKQRLDCAKGSNLLTKEELNHKHLTTDHNDRTIAHDYIRLVIRKVKDA